MINSYINSTHRVPQKCQQTHMKSLHLEFDEQARPNEYDSLVHGFNITIEVSR